MTLRSEDARLGCRKPSLAPDPPIGPSAPKPGHVVISNDGQVQWGPAHPATDCLGVHFMVGLDLDVPRSEVVCGVF